MSATVDDYLGIEEGLHYCNRDISIGETEINLKKLLVEKIVNKFMDAFEEASPSFLKLFRGVFGGGSSYEGLKITEPVEFDIDIMFELPVVTNPVLKESNIPGYVNLLLQDFDDLQYVDTKLYNDLSIFVDENNFLLTKEMKNSFMRSIFDRTMTKYFPQGLIYLHRRKFKISKVTNSGPAITINIENQNFGFSIDLVPCITLGTDYWPNGHFLENPFSCDPELGQFFLIPKSPKRDVPHIERYWRLSFQAQERAIIHDKQWLKPTIRILKRIRDNFGQKLSSYAIKTLFLWELEAQLPSLDSDTIPDMWMHYPLSYCVVFMLGRLLQCLKCREIKYFWNDHMNLIEDIKEEDCNLYKNQISSVISAIIKNPSRKTIVKYLDTHEFSKKRR